MSQDKRVELEDLLGRAENQQQQVDRQLADMDGYNQRALEAVQSGNNVLKDAQDTLRTLQGKCEKLSKIISWCSQDV